MRVRICAMERSHVTHVTDWSRITLLSCRHEEPEDRRMRHANTAERWSQPYILRNLVVTLAIALVWMVAVAATN
jgi:hypothetical protein